LQETVEVTISAPQQPPRGMTRSREPKYTLHQLLHDGPPDDADDAYDRAMPVPASLADLPTAAL